ncbi:amidohydrolase family protein [Pseudooceanicola atlanticus]|uniref:Amidohydrolase n=1 Tax=Pseudooceanicola atlanticus TaxID=1461694 RepID=A0A0A0E9Z3_9RHOB|nr:amidohydrolase family protein [Pseudooceanicola atlanticus]KGM47781.1 amidohydrolase [Pseudooceanicola atlanticus]
MIIDYGATPPIPELSLSDGAHLKNYRRVYASAEKAADRGSMDLEQWFSAVDEAGIDLTVIKARDVETTFGGRVTNEAVAKVVADHPGRFLGFAGVDPNKGMTALRELEDAVTGLGLKGLNIQCFENRLAIDDRRMYPVYAKCIELDIPVNIHVGMNFSLKTSPEFGRPMLLDKVLCDFPDLRVIASPPGWPWVEELLAVAWRHPNLSIGLVAMRPKLLGVENSGYGPLMQYGRTILKDRMLFGTAWPMLPMKRAIEEIRALPIDETIANRWLGENAKALLRL